MNVHSLRNATVIQAAKTGHRNTLAGHGLMLKIIIIMSTFVLCKIKFFDA